MNRYSNKAGFTQTSKGFTLIEMLVSVALFAIVMVVCVGALLSLVGANRKAQALESVMNNLNISLDDMVRAMREGSVYDCGNIGTTPTDCANGSNTFSFAPYNTDTSKPYQPTVYKYVVSAPNTICVTTTGSGGCIIRSQNGGTTFSSLTAPEVSITSMYFYVVGTASGISGDNNQPRVIITIVGTAGGGNVKASTTFHLQATAVQRALDL
jgi:prepilin-type N-terminal cleavage/methylation domain-containing protein